MQTVQTQGLDSSDDRPPRSTDPEPPLGPWDRKFVLSLDGGGVRGLSTLYILAELMSQIATIEKELDSGATHSFYPDPFILPEGPNYAKTEGDPASRYLPCHYFDLICGVSTGGLIAIMLGRLRMSVRDCIHEYAILTKQVFQKPRTWHMKQKPKILLNPFRDKYSSKPLSQAIEKVIQERNIYEGEDAKHFKIPQRLCQNVIFAVEGMESNDFAFVSHDRPRRTATRGSTNTAKIIDVALGATAAPGYFKPHDAEDKRFYDAGIIQVNPCQSSLSEVEAFYWNENDINRGALAGVLSLGTGRLKVRPKVLQKKKSYFRWRHSYVPEFLKTQATNPAPIHREVQRYVDERNDSLYRSRCPHRISYARVTVILDKEAREDEDLHLPEGVITLIEEKMVGLKLDGWSETLVADVEMATEAFLATPRIRNRLSSFANDLVALRRQRSNNNNPHSVGTCSTDAERLWYRYASASEWFDTICRKHFLSHTDINNHFNVHHPGDTVQDNAIREPCRSTWDFR